MSLCLFVCLCVCLFVLRVCLSRCCSPAFAVVRVRSCVRLVCSCLRFSHVSTSVQAAGAFVVPVFLFVFVLFCLFEPPPFLLSFPLFSFTLQARALRLLSVYCHLRFCLFGLFSYAVSNCCCCCLIRFISFQVFGSVRFAGFLLFVSLRGCLLLICLVWLFVGSSVCCLRACLLACLLAVAFVCNLFACLFAGCLFAGLCACLLV